MSHDTLKDILYQLTFLKAKNMIKEIVLDKLGGVIESMRPTNRSTKGRTSGVSC